MPCKPFVCPKVKISVFFIFWKFTYLNLRLFKFFLETYDPSALKSPAIIPSKVLLWLIVYEFKFGEHTWSRVEFLCRMIVHVNQFIYFVFCYSATSWLCMNRDNKKIFQVLTFHLKDLDSYRFVRKLYMLTLVENRPTKGSRSNLSPLSL